MNVQNPNQINNATQESQNSQPLESLQTQSTPVVPQQVVDNTSVEPVKKKSKGCLSKLLIIFISFLVILVILALTMKVWYVPLFRAVFPEESNSSLYTEPQKRSSSNYSETQGWSEISINQGNLLVPLGEIVNRGDEGNGEYSYNFANGDLVYVMPATFSSGSSNYQMRESCFINVDYFQDVKTLPEQRGLSMSLVGKTLLLKGGWGIIPYYYENNEVFVCQMGSISNTEEESKINLVIIPSGEDSELESTYTQVLIFSRSIDQEDIDKIVGSIEIE